MWLFDEISEKLAHMYNIPSSNSLIVESLIIESIANNGISL